MVKSGTPCTRGGAIKDNLQLLFFNTPWAPYRFWCYGLEFLAKVRRVISQRSLGWRTGDEALYGETINISIFRSPLVRPGMILCTYKEDATL